MAQSRPWLGIGLVLLVATGFAIDSSLARLAYDGGSNARSVISMRTAFAVVVLSTLLSPSRLRATLPPPQRRAALALGVLLAVFSYALFEAIEHMPVALAIVTFYTYPLLTGIAAWLTGQERLTALAGGALLLAFLGLALALDAFGGGFGLTGAAYAGLASITFTIVLILTGRMLRGTDSRPVTLHMLIMACLGNVAACVLIGDFARPQSRSGWIGFLGVPLFYTFSIVGIFTAVSWVGPVKTSLATNFEPVASLIIGAIVLGQLLTPWQVLGAGLVVAAIVIMRMEAGWRAAAMQAGKGR